jgi:ABC-2 type transport system permease protein
MWWTLLRHEGALLRTSWIPAALYFVMPLAILAFVEGGFSVYLQVEDPGAGFSGADLAAPGQATMFGFMCLSTIGFLFLGDHAWGTWNRVRSLGVRPWQIMTGKLSVAYLNQLALFAFVMVAATLLFDLTVRGPIVALVAVELLLALVAVSYCLLACAVCRNQAEFNAFAYLGALVMAGLGGALTPFETLPGWAQTIAPLTPTYWSVRGFEAVILDGGGIADVALELAVLALFAAVLATVGSLLFNEDKRRTTWA